MYNKKNEAVQNIALRASLCNMESKNKIRKCFNLRNMFRIFCKE